MPFTPSHAVIALPFIRTPLVPGAIAIGAMTPDLPLFLRGVGVSYSFTHTFAHVVWTALIAFVLFLLWRVVLRPAVPELAPLWLARRLPEDWDDAGSVAAGNAVGIGEKRGYPVLLAISLVLGVLSHIVWDLFTHEDRWGVEVFPPLAEMWGPLLGFKWLQHGSSLLGLAVLGVWALSWSRRRDPRRDVRQRLPQWVRVAWWLSLPVVLVAAWIMGLLLLGPLDTEFTVQHLAYRMLPPACALWGALTLLLCVTLSLRGKAHQTGSSAPHGRGGENS
ncbi:MULTISPECIES: DUF4184 family protein [unclassified Microbacterium]|uniref:DUF4184 family protein n=1 Tax=unclassified Microbacterium TaxID=2609290 RepID=UPI000EA8917D|nr:MULTISPECIES: DUF4184 family protein [unclassified Microbacterium]MBT2486675.1 DUF4184 family protein [Microbacterium sp. ISL-108]RKN64616.1 DUF4184 family protein [Microbacterium sp. CGR2]